MSGIIIANLLPLQRGKEGAPAMEELRRRCFASLCRDYNPTGFSETLLVCELSRYAANMIHHEGLLTTAEQQSQNLLEFVLNPTAHRDDSDQLMSQASADGMGALTREARQNSNTFYARLRELNQLQEHRHGSVASIGPDIRFASESQCVSYLARRFFLGTQSCRRCGAVQDGCLIAARRCWECGACHTQTCIRYRSVMAQSRLPLSKWFHSIRLVLFEPNIAARELAAAISIRRVQTVSAIAAKIRTAMLSENAGELLAELDSVYFGTT